MDGFTQDTLIYIAMGIGLFLLGLVVIKIILSIFRGIFKKTKVDETVATFVILLVKVITLAMLILYILSYFGVSLTPIIALLGVGSAALAIALKDCVGNLAGGLLILVNKPFSYGDTIEAQGIVGKVEKVKLFNTTLITGDNRVVTIPNGQISSAVLINDTMEDERRVDLEFKVDYGSNIENVKNALLETAKACPYTIRVEEILTGVSGYEDGDVKVDLKVWCKTPDYSQVVYYLQEEVRNQFVKNGISPIK